MTIQESERRAAETARVALLLLRTLAEDQRIVDSPLTSAEIVGVLETIKFSLHEAAMLDFDMLMRTFRM